MILKESNEMTGVVRKMKALVTAHSHCLHQEAKQVPVIGKAFMREIRTHRQM